MNIMPARTSALLVGIEDYAAGNSWRLDGPSLDACRLARWLVGRGVPAERIALFVSPLRENALQTHDLAAGIQTAPASQQTIRNFLTGQLASSNSDLLILYWGGHGVIDEGDVRRLLYADAVLRDRRNLDLTNLLRAMRSSSFPGHNRQLVIVDACMNLTQELGWSATMPDSGLSIGRPEPTRDQWVLLAASPGQPAINDDGRKTGLFSEAVRACLEAMPHGQWPPDGTLIRDHVDEVFREHRHLGQTEQVPSRIWYRSREEERLLFSVPPPIGDSQSASRPDSKLLTQYATNLWESLQLLPLDSLGASSSLPLGDVYTELRATDDDATIHKSANSGSDRLDEIVRKHTRVVVLGAPGSGKSTFLRHLCGSLVAPGLAGGGVSTHQTIPILTRAKYLAGRLPGDLETLSPNEVDIAMRKVLREAWKDGLQDLFIDPSTLETLLMSPSIALLFDGLDEVSEWQRPWIRRAIESASQHPGVRLVVVTCRNRSYRGTARLAGFTQISIAPLDPAAIELMASRLLASLQDEEGGRAINSRRFEEAILQNRKLRDLASNPLLLTSLAILYSHYCPVSLISWSSGGVRRAMLLSQRN